MWKKIFDTLKSNGIDVYAPTQHTGDCIAPYVVVIDGGKNRLAQFSTDRQLYDILVQVPKTEYSKIEDYKKTVKDAMKTLYPSVQLTRREVAPILDESIKGFTSSIEYMCYMKHEPQR